MMTTETLILLHLMRHSGQKPGQIAVAIERSVLTVKVALSGMTTAGDVWHDAEARYHASEPVGDCDEKYVTLCDKALSLQDRNLWNRAARVWLEAHDATNRPGLRQKAIVHRTNCIKRANLAAPKAELDFPLKGRRQR